MEVTVMNGKGRCLCGAVKFEAMEIETEIHACNCSMCRRWNGSPALASTVGSVTFTGEENIERYPSSEWAERGFCKRCGTNLFYLYKPNTYNMWIGSFDEQPFKLVGEIYCENKPNGYSFSGDHPRHKELPNT
jgi:hypothetical protein